MKTRASTTNLIFIVLLTLFASSVFVLFKSPVLASSTDGTIDSSDKYAWSENAGWLNFGTSQGNVHVTDSALSGYAWAENIGWISLNCSNDSSCATVDYKVANDGEGTLSGYAWSENAGWVNFNPTYGGVTINSSGEFLGYAWGENIGWVVFNCSTTSSCGTVDYKVKTDWRPQSTRAAATSSSTGSGLILLPFFNVTQTQPTTPLQTFPAPNHSAPTPPANQHTTTPPGSTLPHTSPSAPPITSAPQPATPEFTQDFSLGSQQRAVKLLQEFLNRHGFVLAATGYGSPGNETDYFGPLTSAALRRFQQANLAKAPGMRNESRRFGPVTRAYVNSLIGNAPTNQTTETHQTGLPSALFTTGLARGMNNADVRRLQQLLASKPDIYPEGLVTGYFGPLTEQAVRRFQLKYGVVRSGADPGYGYVGPKTRAMLQSVFGNNS